MTNQNVVAVTLRRAIALGNLVAGTAVTISETDGGVIVPSGAAAGTLAKQKIIGVVLNDFDVSGLPADYGPTAEIVIATFASQILLMRSYGVINADVPVIASNAGLIADSAIPVNADFPAATYSILGRTLEASTAANQLIRVLVTNNSQIVKT